MYTTAHFWEENLIAQTMAVGDYFKLLRAYTMPGQDCLGLSALRVHDFKEGQSVSEFGHVRFASEVLGASDFEPGMGRWGTFTPPRLKQSLNAVIAWGVSHIIPHGVFTTRKLDGNPWPPDWYNENPMFPYLHLWADCARRASYINSHGRLAADVLLFNPLDSVWICAGREFFARESNYKIWSWRMPAHDPRAARADAINQAYVAALNALTDARVEFLVTDRHYFREMTVAGPALTRGDFAFRAVVLPPLDVLPLDVAGQLVRFAAAGGRVYALGELPTGSVEQGLPDPAMGRLMDALRACPTFKTCAGGLQAELDAGAPGLTSQVTFTAGAFPLRQHHLQIDGREFFWLANNGDQWRECAVTVAGARGGAAIWDCETGRIRPVRSAAAAGGSRLALVFKPYEAYWLVFDPETQPHDVPAEARPRLEPVLTLAGPWRVVYDPAIQPRLEHPRTPPAEFAPGTEKPLEPWSNWGLDKFSGLLDYSTTFTLARTGGPLQLDLGRVYHVAEVWVNGRSLGARLWGPHMFDATAAVRRGRNEVRVRVANLVNNSYGEAQESGLLGPVQLLRPVAGQPPE